MLYSIAADIFVFLHFLWILFLIFGVFIGRRNKWVKRIHISGIFFAFLIQIFGWYCPLTHLEVRLRSMHDASKGYPGSFIIHYIGKIVYIDLSPGLILIMTVVLAFITALLYLYPKRGS